MFGWTGFKYRNQVIIDIHSILMFVPELKKLLKTVPNLRRSAGEFRKLGKTELEAAVYLSAVVLESVLAHVPEHGRNEALAELTRFENDRFRWFRDQLANESGTAARRVGPVTHPQENRNAKDLLIGLAQAGKIAGPPAAPS
jgi:hypothetical protein